MSGKHECAYCHDKFVTITDHMIHVMTTHDRGFVPRDRRVALRPSSFWNCASDVWPDEEKRLICKCGFDVGEAWSHKFKPLPENDAG